MPKDEISARLIEINSTKNVSKNAKLPILKQQVVANGAKGKKDAIAVSKENEPATKPHKYVLTHKKRGYENSQIEAMIDQSQQQDSAPSGSATIEDSSAAALKSEARKKSRKNSVLLDNFNIIDVVPSDYLCQEETELEVRLVPICPWSTSRDQKMDFYAPETG